MKLIPLIGLALKDPEIVEILEHFEARVIYDFDRFFENQPDSYWAHLYSEGLLFRFDENQHLVTIFVYLKPTEEFCANSGNSLDFDIFESIEEARAFAAERGLPYNQNRDNPEIPVWIRIEHRSCFIHYQFGDVGLVMVTLMDLETAP